MIWLILLYFNVNWSNNSRRHIFSVYSSRNFFLWITIKLSLFNCEWISEMLLLLLVWIQSFLVVVVVVIVIILKRKNGFFFLPWFFFGDRSLLPNFICSIIIIIIIGIIDDKNDNNNIPKWYYSQIEIISYILRFSAFSLVGHTMIVCCLLLLLKCEFSFIHSFRSKQPNESQNNSYRWWDTRWWWLDW